LNGNKITKVIIDSRKYKPNVLHKRPLQPIPVSTGWAKKPDLFNRW